MKDKDTVSPTYDLTRELRITGYGLEYARKEIIRPYEERIAQLEKENTELRDEVQFLNTAENEWFLRCSALEEVESRLSAANEYLKRNGNDVEF